MRAELLLTNLRLAGFGPGHRIAVADGIVAAILPPSAAEPEAAKVLDLDGDLVLPGLVDGHMHLDKTLFGLPWTPHAGRGVSESTRGGSRQWPRGQMVVRVLGNQEGTAASDTGNRGDANARSTRDSTRPAASRSLAWRSCHAIG